MNLAHLVHRLISDTTFAMQFRQNPQLALSTAGYKLSSNEVSTLVTMMNNTDHWEKLFSPQETMPQDLKWYLP